MGVVSERAGDAVEDLPGGGGETSGKGEDVVERGAGWYGVWCHTG